MHGLITSASKNTPAYTRLKLMRREEEVCRCTLSSVSHFDDSEIQVRREKMKRA